MVGVNSSKDSVKDLIKSRLLQMISKYRMETPIAMKASEKYKQRNAFEVRWRRTGIRQENREMHSTINTVLITVISCQTFLSLSRANRVQSKYLWLWWIALIVNKLGANRLLEGQVQDLTAIKLPHSRPWLTHRTNSRWLVAQQVLPLSKRWTTNDRTTTTNERT